MNGVSPWEIIRLMFSADGTVGNSGFGLANCPEHRNQWKEVRQ